MDEFLQLKKMLKYIHNKLFYCYGHFMIYEALEKIKAPNIVGKDDAVKNADIMNDYPIFFALSIEAHKKIFYLELAKMFDFDKKAASMIKIINCAHSNLSKLTVIEFEKANKNRKFLPELKHGYAGITKKDIENIKNNLLNIGLDVDNKEYIPNSLVEGIMQKRNQYLAHNQLNVKKDITTSSKEIKKVFEILDESIEIISSKLDHVVTEHFHEKKNIEIEIESLIIKLGAIKEPKK